MQAAGKNVSLQGMRITPYIILFAAVLTAGCNRDISYTDPATDPVTVFEYTPAPGQFINESEMAGVTTPGKACEFAEKRIAAGQYVSLGGFGGYIVVGFGKSITNSGGYDFSVAGNQMLSSSEPGVVWVMQDMDGDGEPDAGGTWYELRGSETGNKSTVQGYKVTYFRPAEDNADVEWTDNREGSGVVARVSAHTQPSYYPAWIGADSYTLGGTLLESRSGYDEDTKQWTNGPYDWGYADNWGLTLGNSGDRGEGKDQIKVWFKISNAVDAGGKSVNLPSIDFIKVQTAVNAGAGPLGEVSTEVTGFAVGSEK